MEQDIFGRNDTREERTENDPKQAKKSLTNSSKCRNRSQQPGRYLCVDTRKEQVYIPSVRPHSSYTHNFSSPSTATRLKHFNKDAHQNSSSKNLKTLQNRTVEPDSQCKFKTTLAIDYVRDILEENARNSRSISRRNISVRKKGHLEPLLGAGQSSLEPNVKKCLGIQNDRQKKIVTLDDGLEVREEVISPGLTRFSSVAKNISRNTLTVDLRKLSLVTDQSESLTSDAIITYEEQPGIRPGDFRKNPNARSITMNHKNIESKIDGSDRSQTVEQNNNKSTDSKHWSDFCRNHTIDNIDSDQDIDDTTDYSYKCDDHVVDLSSPQLHYNRADIGETEYIDIIRDDTSLNHRVSDYRGFIDDDINSNDGHQGQNTLKGSERNFRGFQDNNMIENKGPKTNLGLKSSKSERKLIYVNSNLISSNNNNCLRMNEESNPNTSVEKFLKPEEITSVGENFDHTISKKNIPQLDTNLMFSNEISGSKLTQGNGLNTSSSITAKDFKVNTDYLDRQNSDNNVLILQLDENNTTTGGKNFYKNCKPSHDDPAIYRKSHLEYSDHDKVQQKALSSSTNSTIPLLNPSTPNQNRKQTNGNQLIHQKSHLNTPDIDRPQQLNTSVASGSPRFANSTIPSPRFPEHIRKPTNENQEIYQEPQVKHSDIDRPQQNTSIPPLSSSSNSTIPSINPSTPDQDSIQVKDIWKALVDGGYDISREEVSKYKVSSTKRRIKSAPSRTRSSRNNTSVKDVPTRAKSAINRDSRERLSKKEYFENLNEEGESEEIRKKNPTIGGFFQEHASATKLYNDQSSSEVVAVSKPVTKLPRKKNIPLIPPLNFQINTMPKSDYFFYFAYGLNMNQKRLEIQLRCQTGVQYWGLLFGFRLLFNKKGSTEGGVGFPNIVHEPGFSVEGCVYELSLDCLSLLDTCVGFPKHYSRLVLPVWMCNCLDPSELGVAQHCVPAVVYVAQDDWVASDPTTLDTSFTLKQCALGTDLLTSNYQQFLDNFNK